MDGVQAACCFPSFPGFGGRVFLNASDKDLAFACLQAWNDFSVDEWSATAPGRYVPLALLPIWDVDRCVSELRRVAAKGARVVSFPDSPVPLGLPSFHSDHWGPLWDVFEDTGVVVSLHFGSGSFVPGFSASAKQFAPNYKGGEFKSVSARTGGNSEIKDDDAPTCTSFAVYATNLMWTASDLVFSGQLQKHPRLKFMLAEGGIGWFPYIWERMDQVLAAAPLLPADRLRRAAERPVQEALLGLLHRGRVRHQEPPRDRHRPYLRRDRLPALGQQLAQQPQGHRHLTGGRPR